MLKPLIAGISISLAAVAAPTTLFAHGGDDHTKAWNAPKGAAARPNPMSASPENIAAGKKLFNQFCTQCHGHDGIGNPAVSGIIRGKPTNLTHSADHHSAGDLFWKIRTGRSAMPSYKLVFRKRQIWEMVTYIKTLAAKE